MADTTLKISQADMENVANLSRLNIPEQDADEYIKELSEILDYIDNLQQINTDDIQPTTYALPMQNVFREDEVRPSLDREKALQNAPVKEDGYFKVPRVLEE